MVKRNNSKFTCIEIKKSNTLHIIFPDKLYFFAGILIVYYITSVVKRQMKKDYIGSL